MGGPKSKATRAEVLAAFQTDETFKGFAARIGMSPNTLREIWKGEFGEDAFVARGKRLQAAAASIVAKTTAKYRIIREVQIKCNECGAPVKMRANTATRFGKNCRCPDCQKSNCDRSCPVCGLLVEGAKGLGMHFRHRREAGDQIHISYQEAKSEAKWTDLTPNLDYVICLECGHRAETLAGHLKASHGINAVEYKKKHGLSVRIRSLRLEGTRSIAAKNRKGGFGKGSQKIVTCPSCGESWEGSKFLCPDVHDLRCNPCKEKADAKDEAFRWENKIETSDYVICLECEYRAENLTSHLQHRHPGYRERHPEGEIVARCSAVRDKSALKGLVRPPEFGQKIRESKLLGLTMEDFLPFFEDNGTVDQREMLKIIKCGWPTLKSYMDDLGLKPTRKYLEASKEAHRVILTTQQLGLFKLGNGKISLAKAMLGTGYCKVTIKKECVRLGLRCAYANVAQLKCLTAISEALGSLPFQMEWSQERFTNRETGHRFRFDGYFSDVNLVVEFQGHQHYLFPNAYMRNESYRPEWEKLKERDRVKREMIENSQDLIYLEVFEDEPYTDISYLRSRLIQLGITPVS
ncbi:MAG: MucR family transcriptional regulator [Bacteroidota bacterium]|jgi:predicted transcriptional regulator